MPASQRFLGRLLRRACVSSAVVCGVTLEVRILPARIAQKLVRLSVRRQRPAE